MKFSTVYLSGLFYAHGAVMFMICMGVGAS